MNDKSANNKLLGLEIIRFVSALAVLIWHYQHFAFVVDRPVDLVRDAQPFYGIFKLFYEAGHHGVEIFWCVSGFIFFLKYRDLLADGVVGGRQFFVLRFSRLYPLHFVTLLLVLALQMVHFGMTNHYFVYQFNDLPHFIYQLFLASNWGFQSGDSFNGPIWSISIEVLVYVLFFFASRYLGKSLLVPFGILLACGVAKIVHYFPSLLACIAFFYAGGLAAIASQRFGRAEYPWLYRAGAMAVVVAPILVWALHLYERQFFVFVFLMSYTPLLLCVASGDLRVPMPIQKIIETAGNMTYSSYLIHFPLQLSVLMLFMSVGKPVPMYDATFFAIYLVGTLLLSMLIYRHFEVPAQSAIRKRFPGRTRRRDASISPR